LFLSTKANPIIIASYQISSWMSPWSISWSSKLILSSSHIFRFQLRYLSKVWCPLIIEFYSCHCNVDLIHIIAHDHASRLFNESLSNILKCHPLIPNHCPLNLNFMYWTIQFANELIEYFHALWLLAQCLSVLNAI
jgi:hypothetical protein